MSSFSSHLDDLNLESVSPKNILTSFLSLTSKNYNFSEKAKNKVKVNFYRIGCIFIYTLKIEMKLFLLILRMSERLYFKLI